MRRERAERRPGPGDSSSDMICWVASGPRRHSGRFGPLRRHRGAHLRGCELASPFLAKPIQTSFAGLRNPPQSPPGRAPHCTPAGGYMRKEQTSSCGGAVGATPRHLSTAAFAGRRQSHIIHRRSRVVPYGLPGCRRFRREPPQPRDPPAWPCARGSAASGKTL